MPAGFTLIKTLDIAQEPQINGRKTLNSRAHGKTFFCCKARKRGNGIGKKMKIILLLDV